MHILYTNTNLAAINKVVSGIRTCHNNILLQPAVFTIPTASKL